MHRKISTSVYVRRDGGFLGTLRGFSDSAPTINMEDSGDIKGVFQGTFEKYLYDQKGNRLEFIHTAAEKYEVPADADTFYFFNPFSVELLQSVWKKISRSYYEDPREMLLFFYYPSDEYTAWLMTVPELEFYDEISCEDLFD